MATQSEDVRVLAAPTNLLLSQLADLHRLQASSQAATEPVTELLDQIADRADQTANETKSHLSRALTALGADPSGHGVKVSAEVLRSAPAAAGTVVAMRWDVGPGWAGRTPLTLCRGAGHSEEIPAVWRSYGRTGRIHSTAGRHARPGA